MPQKLTDKVEDIGMAIVYAAIIMGGVAFSMWNGVNLTIKPVYNVSNPSEITGYTTVLDPTQTLAWGLLMTFGLLAIAFAFIGNARQKKNHSR